MPRRGPSKGCWPGSKWICRTFLKRPGGEMARAVCHQREGFPLPTDRARGQTTAMPTAVAAARQSYADHPMVRLETAPPGPCHAVSLQETPSDPCSTSATVILSCPPPGNSARQISASPCTPPTSGRSGSWPRPAPTPSSDFPSDRQSLPWITVYRAAAATADETGLLNVDVAWCGEHVTEFAAGFTQLHRYRGIMEEGPGVMVEEQHILGALSLADESIAHLEACDPAQVDAFAVAVILPN